MPINRYIRNTLVILATVFLPTIQGIAQKKDASLVALNECWHYDMPDLSSSQPATDKSNLYIAEDGGRVSAISLSTGTRLWSSELGGEVRSNVAVVGSNVYVVTVHIADAARKGLRLRMLSANTGIPNLDIEIPYAEDIRLLPLTGKIVVVTNKGYVATFDAGATKPGWQKSYPVLRPETAIVWSDKIVLGSVDAKIYVLAVDNGAEISSIETENPVSALGIIDGDIIWGDDRGNLVRYNLDKHSV
ncbi:MAG TPA: PQQ-binding-like beta-propeller repeat protein, partial [Pyrinomonadaceae bacterium]|nr:PQQ-binding-like beta-propeller repeat protein [Pyrinomonadaceae bacterium]